MNAEDEAAFGSYVTARLPALLRLAHLLTGSAHEADDLVQNALVRTCRAWPRIRNQGDPDAYVRRVMVNARNSWWSRRRPESSTELLPERAAAPVLDFDERDRMWTALATLPRKQRAVLVLRYYEDLSEAEIADVLGCSAGTVKSQAHKALAKLRALPDLADHPNFHGAEHEEGSGSMKVRGDRTMR